MKSNYSRWRMPARILANIGLVLLAGFFLMVALPVGIAFVVLLVAYNILSIKDDKEVKAQAEALEAASSLNESQNERITALAQYEQIVDAAAEAASVKAAAAEEAERITQLANESADLTIHSAEAKAESIVQEANDNVQTAREAKAAAEVEANRRLDSAGEEARRIVAEAEAKAEKIAGEAFALSGRAAELRETVTALENAIKGYGDEWMKPTYSLLDELADEFGYEEGGRKLKEARSLTNRMVTNGTAAECDYVETMRKTTAIRFVIDAFNGKVDSILSKVRHDNYGKLERQIMDAFSMVNMNGKAFRNARITEAYLNARLQELKWAVVVFELHKKAQEEQRQLREQMREEARARREYERAQKAAAKEEAMLKKAMEKAKAMLAQANEEKRAEFEAKLADLEQKLKEAEEKGQRALSMAQQTKHGNVYVISNIGSFGKNVYKVGMTRRLNPLDRVRELGDASVPFAFDVHAIIESDDAPALEHTLHQELALMQVNKVNPRKEFFRASLDDIRALVESHGLSVQWTMVAEAAEYRETQAIEARMKDDPEAQKQWEAFYGRLGDDLPEDDEDADIPES